MHSPYLDVKELAERHKQSPQAIYQRKWRGEGPPCIKVGRKLLFPLEGVERWERQQSVLAE